jgi:glycosyltransferase involved in cell wall biosynthesis
LRSVNIGLFVEPEPVRVAQRSADRVTFINPQPEKGVTLFLKLLERAARVCPEMRFLVVESRAKLAPALKKLGLPEQLLERVTLLPRQQNLREVYRQTRILLMPSFWFEAAGRVLIEANANGIPVIATHRGGIPETLAGAGVLLDIPQAAHSNHWHVPSEQELDPWWAALLALWSDPQHYRQHSERALQAAATHSLPLKTERVLRLLHQAVTQRRQQPPAGSLPAATAVQHQAAL